MSRYQSFVSARPSLGGLSSPTARLSLRDWPTLAAALLLALIGGAAAVELPITVALPLAAVLAGVVMLGPELLIVTALIAATGLMPFVNPTDSFVPNVKNYFLFFSIAAVAMFVTWVARRMAGRPSMAAQPSFLVGATVVLLIYALLSMAASSPLSQPTLAGPVIEFPLMAAVTYLWLSQKEALEGLRRVLPIAVGIIVIWTISYIAGAGGCGPCSRVVSADLFHEGLLGPRSRLYAAGQNSLLGLVLVAFAQALRKATPLTVGLTVLGLAAVTLQASRAQYIAVLAGIAMLLGWQLTQTRSSGKLWLGVAALAAGIGILVSPVGERALTAYDDVSSNSGTAGYRAQLVEASSENWSMLGDGVTSRTADLGVNVDLGLPNTIIVLGFVGAALQLIVLLFAFWRGLSAGSLAGATLAAIFLLVLVARPTLPLIELGHSTITYGACVGFTAWLYVSRPKRYQVGSTRRRLEAW